MSGLRHFIFFATSGAADAAAAADADDAASAAAATGVAQGWASVLFKRTFRSFRSFPFFSKERSVLSVLFRSF